MGAVSSELELWYSGVLRIVSTFHNRVPARIRSGMGYMDEAEVVLNLFVLVRKRDTQPVVKRALLRLNLGRHQRCGTCTMVVGDDDSPVVLTIPL